MTEFGNKKTALAVTALYVVIVALLMLYVEVEKKNSEALQAYSIVVDLTPEQIVEETKMRPEADAPATKPELGSQSAASKLSGNADRPRTINQRALFKMNSDGADQPQNAGNDNLPKGERTQAEGDGSGHSLVGESMLDASLAGRGLVGELPVPDFPDGCRAGKIVIRVSVDSSGRVTSAIYEAKGSTSSSAALISAAKNAALKARFQESRAMVEGGTITYVFKIK